MKITRDSDSGIDHHLLVSEMDLGKERAWKEGEKLSQRKMTLKIEFKKR